MELLQIAFFAKRAQEVVENNIERQKKTNPRNSVALEQDSESKCNLGRTWSN